MDRSKPLIIRDEIHGDISFEETLKHVINHPCFQRLRYIKQIGLAEYVFPCATHNRFQHSLGASFLAGQYFETMLKGWLASPMEIEGKAEKTQFFGTQTRESLARAANHYSSLQYWHRTAMMAALLHDVGHGPWSHTFEALDLRQDFSAVIKGMDGVLRKYFVELAKSKIRIRHEDVSIIYIYKIFRDLEEEGTFPEASAYTLAVASLANRRLGWGPLQEEVEAELEAIFQKQNIYGGVAIHRLIRPIISGPFDVDRIDYIQRDGRNCGVNIGGIEWRRIVTKLIPCLAKHESKGLQPSDVVLISNIKNQHVLDDFIFSLFQMYAQVYMHPKIIALEEVTRRLVKKKVTASKGPVVTFDLHSSLSDDGFREMLKKEFGIPEVDDILYRRANALIRVVSTGPSAESERELKKEGFFVLEADDRPMMKDSLGVFLYSSFDSRSKQGIQKRFVLNPWEKVSPLAQYFVNVNYSPRVWIKTGVLG